LSFTKIATQILQQYPNASYFRGLDLQKNDEVIEVVKLWLSLPENTRWLVIYDNYDNPTLDNDGNNKEINIH
jgi:hypothetical protein